MSEENKNTQLKPPGDLESKTVFHNLRLAATLFKNFTEEFRGMDEDEIEEYIEKDSEGCPLEFKDELYALGTDYVRLDSLLEARVPGKKNECVRIRFNIETQVHYSPGYSLADRVQMYAAMLLATQNKESKGRDKYSNLKRSYTVWICPRGPKSLDGQFFPYGVLPYRDSPDELNFSSLMDIVFVFPGKPVEDPEDKSVTDLLSIIFSGESAEFRQSQIANKYNITLDLLSLMEVEHFTDWGLEIRQDAYDEGLADGKAKGKAEGMAKAVLGISKRLHCSIEESAEIAEVPEDMMEEVLKAVKVLQKN